MSTNTLAFAANDATSPTPAPQTVSGMVSGALPGPGTLYVIATVQGAVISSVSDFVISGSSGSAQVSVVSPEPLGTGTYHASVTVRACMNDKSCATGELSGSPRTIDVTYTVGSTVQQDSVMPHVVGANEAGSLVIRGQNLGTVKSVSLGSQTITDIVQVSTTEVQVPYPALPPGTYTVTLDNGGAPFTGSVVVVGATGLADQTLAYPSVPIDVPALFFDAERNALLVGVRSTDQTQDMILRYAATGANFGSPATATKPDLRDLSLSQDGSKLLALEEEWVEELDPTTLVQTYRGANSDLFGSIAFMRTFALLNDGYTIITSDHQGSGRDRTYLYSSAHQSFFNFAATSMTGLFDEATVGASADGSIAVIEQWGTPVSQYSPRTGVLTATTLTFADGLIDYYRPALDRSGTRIVLGSAASSIVYDSNYATVCALPSDTHAYVVNQAGTRVYTLNNSSEVQAFDVTQVAGTCSQIGASIPVPDPGLTSPQPAVTNNVRMVLSPDGGTLFLAGVNAIVVRQAPQ